MTRKTIKQVEHENEVLKDIVKNTLWMARRYADNRSSYAPAVFNFAVHDLDALGLAHLHAGDPADNGKRFADDGMFGKYDPVLKDFIKEA